MKQKIILDYEQMLGATTPTARKISSSWENVNLSAGDDDYVQGLAREFIDFHAQLIGKPYLSGLIEHSASLANERALKIAKERTGKRKVLLSNLSHSSIEDVAAGKKGFFSGIGLEPIVINVDPDNNFQVNEEDLKRKIKGHGKNLAAIISTYGTTQLGHVETIAKRECVKQLREDGTWLHIDAAYGGVLSRFSTLARGELPDADSFTLDPYKFVGKLGCALLLTDRKNLPFSEVPYYNRSQFTLATSISVEPIIAWMQSIRDCSKAGLRELANDSIYQARVSATRLRNAGLNVLYGPKLAVVPIRLDSLDEANNLRNDLRSKGFKIGKLNIQGNDYSILGVRFTITPKYYELNSVGRLTNALIKSTSKIISI